MDQDRIEQMIRSGASRSRATSIERQYVTEVQPCMDAVHEALLDIFVKMVLEGWEDIKMAGVEGGPDGFMIKITGNQPVSRWGDDR